MGLHRRVEWVVRIRNRGTKEWQDSGAPPPVDNTPPTSATLINLGFLMHKAKRPKRAERSSHLRKRARPLRQRPLAFRLLSGGFSCPPRSQPRDHRSHLPIPRRLSSRTRSLPSATAPGMSDAPPNCLTLGPRKRAQRPVGRLYAFPCRATHLTGVNRAATHLAVGASQSIPEVMHAPQIRIA